MKLLQLSLRELFLLVVIAAIGCGWWMHYQSFSAGLYSDADAEVMKAMHVVGSDNRGDDYLVVENGNSMPRWEVFERLGIADHRLRDYRAYVANNDCTLLWQISPHYDLVCRTGADDSPQLASDPQRKVYGVQIRERNADELIQ
jgi:hypothetical protein